MRRRLIEALTYPRFFVLGRINLEDCPQDGVFDSSCDRCRECGLGQECHWLSFLDNFSDLARKPIHTIHASLLYSISLIDAYIEQIEHDRETCACESCTWNREARKLSQEFSRKFLWMLDKDRRAEQIGSRFS